ncbi:putative nitrate reductase [Aspergillus thermomutatus]|uniref:Nitrate reductase [NADPH] n=1 Tax=Aspergillus thermomutatus TaxID=41047 RepID=A0A397HKK1_ASPTH|nr:uncharacterized protein CDV56_102526 [Aspergillus thermomutatus]RHZ63579.1 hypothetical protein CDV56_102526 [Aspergillus thermomutatus]
MGVESIDTDCTANTSRDSFKSGTAFHGFDDDTFSYTDTVELSVTEANTGSREWRPRVKEWLVLICVSILTMLVAFDATMVIPFIPGLSLTFGEPLSSTLWLNSCYLLASATGQMFFSILAEVIGHGPLLVAAAVVSTIGTGVCGGSLQLSELVAGRFIQGLGGGGVLSVSLLCLAENIPDKHLVRFSSYVSRVRLVGAILGLVMGTLFYEYIAWRGAFYSSFFFCALGMLVIPFAVELRGHRGISSRTLLKMDWLGAVLTLLALCCFLIGISWGGTSYPWSDWRVLTPLVLGTSSTLVLALYETNWAVRPFFRKNDFRTLPALMMYIGSFLHGFTLFYHLQNLTIYFIFVRSLPLPLTAASLASIMALALFALALTEKLPVLDDRRHSFWLVRVGWMLIILCTGCLVTLDSTTPTAGWILVLVATGTGHGCLVSGYQKCLRPAPVPRDYGDQEERSINPTSALLMCSLFRTVGMCIAVTVSGTMFLDHVAEELKGQSFESAHGQTTETAWARIPDDRFRSTCTASLEFLCHRVGVRNRDDRFPGLTHEGDDWRYELEKEAEKRAEELRAKAKTGELLTVRGFLAKQEDFHLRRPDVHPKHWRYVLHTTEEFIKEEQPWLINEKKKEQEEKDKEKGGEQQQDGTDGSEKKPAESDQGEKKEGGKEEDSQPKYTPEQQAPLEYLKQEAEFMRSLKSNDGMGRSPVGCSFIPGEIDEADQFTPDNWVPRTDHLIRITGKHPLNGEPQLVELLDAGLITPNWLHYVRSHGQVPHLLWENHKLEISAGKSLTLFMDDLKDQFNSINIPALMACDGNRRKELNLIKRSKGFNFGPGAVGCAYWKGVLVRDVLLMADILQLMDEYKDVRLWVNFGGAELLSEGKYETSIPLDYCMDPCNDVILAYEMNDSPLPADHGYPLRLVIPGYVGGRSVKWLEKIWVTDYENDTYYHIFDNRVVPSFVTDRFDEIGQTMYHHPSTACMEQMLNSVIARPAQGERIDLAEMRKGKKYRITGYAYNGGGNEVQRVEVSLDGGANWLYCVRKEILAWLHWHVDIDITQLLRAEQITVRCWDVNKNTQPEKPTWNLEGMMNNSHYIVKSETSVDPTDNKSYLLFRHPVEPGTGENGWMKPSISIQKEDIRRSAAVPEKQFTREEIEKHTTDQDCWIVINGKVYGATSVLSWHPGGKAPIMAHAGRVHQETTEEYESIHDDYAVQKLEECLLGSVTQKTSEFIKKEAEETAKEKAKSAEGEEEVALKRHKTGLSFVHTPLPDPSCRPKKTAHSTSWSKRTSLVRHDQAAQPGGTTRRHNQAAQPGGTMSNILDCVQEGEEIEVKGPAGEIRYRGKGEFLVDDKTYHFDHITLILGGSGITPGYQLIARILKTEQGSGIKVRAIDANRSEEDILLRGELDKFAQEHPDQFQITYVLSHPGDNWKGEKGHVNEEILHKFAFEPGEKNAALLCGPPTMIQKAVLPVLKKWGYDEDKNLFGF